MKIADSLGKSMSAKDAHKLRTSVRRIEVAVEPLGRFSGSKKLQSQLNLIRKKAGHVRDIDVQTDLLRDLDAGDYGQEREALKSALHRRRDKFETKAIAEIDKQLDKGMEERMERAAKILESQPPQRRVAGKIRVGQIRDRYVEFTTEVPLDGDALHDLRKASKRLRYRLEAIPGRESRSLAKDLKAVQDAVGTWHDWASLTEEAEKRLAPGSISFVAFLRSLTLAKRNEARRTVQTLREKLMRTSQAKKPPASAGHHHGTLQRAMR
jgi:CHAD domain-containing protein